MWITVSHDPPPMKSDPAANQEKVKGKSTSKGKMTNFKCNKCDTVFRTSSGHTLHSQYSTMNYYYFCDECKENFVAKRYYEQHMRVHLKKSTFVQSLPRR